MNFFLKSSRNYVNMPKKRRDADSGDEDGGGTIDNLNRNLLQADAELVGQEDGSDDEAAESVAPTNHRWGKREVASYNDKYCYSLGKESCLGRIFETPGTFYLW
ncbi:hypothetical protein FJT64_027634 [Amphibalanus amphitrite]|uniref:Uncharacterized protein n=1 Tax=Amphibalanus amphitrite TaxID=1232801 RepID=A0A6A4W171_AMPAM|nr:hypothetical protein FJT64_027634 [Amphibalanus amphitrite]